MLLYFRLTFPRGHFPRLAECAHFHYETVDFGTVQVRPGPELNTHTFYGEQKSFVAGILVIVSLTQFHVKLSRHHGELFHKIPHSLNGREQSVLIILDHPVPARPTFHSPISHIEKIQMEYK
jgi:hypothetical protein